MTSACASKTRAQHTSTDVRIFPLRANFRKSKRYVSIKPFQIRERILFLLMEQVAPSNLESGTSPISICTKEEEMLEVPQFLGNIDVQVFIQKAVQNPHGT